MSPPSLTAALAAPVNLFAAYSAAGFTEDLLPIMPHDAQLRTSPGGDEGLAKSRGKVPGRKRGRTWCGLQDWTTLIAHAALLDDWHSWGAGVGMQGRRFPALDIDVEDDGLAEAVHRYAEKRLGIAPVRFGRGCRRILVFAGAGFNKRRLVLARPGETIVDEQGRTRPRTHAVELLATGQQYVVEGIHPKTLMPYRWDDGRSPAVIGAAALPPISEQAVDAFFDGLPGLLEVYGYEVLSRSAGTGGDGAVWQEGLLAPSIDAIRRAMAALPNEADRDTWLKICAAIKASAGVERLEEAYDIWMEWSLQWPENTPDSIDAMWRSLGPKYQVGWDFIARFATEEGDGTFHAAEEDFDAVAEPPAPGEESKGPPVAPKVERMFDRWVWVERLKRACDTRSGELLDREQFNVRNAHIGPPTSKDESAWAVLISNPKRLQAVKAVTYRPGGELFINERLPGLTGPCINRWKDPALDLPATATDADIAPWMAHVEFVVPDPRERTIMLDWLAWIIQNPGEKPNWALVLGSTAEGIGKDMMIEPVRAALGAANVREITAEDLASNNSDYLENTRLLLVEEMEMAERKSMMNKLKPVIAAPPYTLRVNIKFQPQFEIPNLIAAIFFTNMENALHLSRQGRRYFVMWNEGEPRPDAYYAELAAWFEAGGAAKAARWLLNRDVASFNAKGRAPETAARENMRRASRPRLEELIEDGLGDGQGIFRYRLFTLDDVANSLRERLNDTRITNNKVAAAMRKFGCVALGRYSLEVAPPDCSTAFERSGEPTLFARKSDQMDQWSRPAVRDAYWAERRMTPGDPREILQQGITQ